MKLRDSAESPIGDHNRMKRPSLPSGAFTHRITRRPFHVRLEFRMQDAHNGRFEESCNACKELRVKSEKSA